MIKMNTKISVLFLLFFFVVSCPIHTVGLKCYQCSDEDYNNCGDTFNLRRYGVREVNSTSGYCWKLKAQYRQIKGVLRGGNWLSDLESGLYCPGINKCQTKTSMGVKATLCCCQNQDFCNTASIESVQLWTLLLSATFTYIFVRLY